MLEQEKNNKQYCGYIAVIGKPNAGKSTLINEIIGEKVSIVSAKVQTTRRRILGITTDENKQLILIDTPGIFMDPKRRLEKSMIDDAWKSISGADAVVFLVDASRKKFDDDFAILERIQHGNVILILNKIDKIQKEQLLTLTEHFNKAYSFKKTFMISALKKNGVDEVKKALLSLLPESPWFYPEDQLTDLSERLWAAEMTREQLIRHFYHELPYETWVETENWENFKNGSIKIHQVIYVARDTQKAILLGKKGQSIKLIGEGARKEMTERFGTTVHLFLHIKVAPDWFEKPSFYKHYGLSFEAGS